MTDNNFAKQILQSQIALQQAAIDRKTKLRATLDSEIAECESKIKELQEALKD